MSSFVTNKATRRGKKARVEGARYQNVLATTGPPEGTAFEHSGHPNIRRPHLHHTIIGGHQSKGLTIQGGLAAFDHTVGNNPDGRDVPLGTSGQAGGKNDGRGLFPNDSLANPKFPITYSGPGHLYFPGEIEIPAVRGHMNVSGRLTWTNSFTEDVSNVGIEDGSGNALTISARNGILVRHGGIRFYRVQVAWTSLGSASGALRITGLPCVSTLDRSTLTVRALDGVATSEIGGNFVVQYNSGATRWDWKEESMATGAVAADVEAANLDATGEIILEGWIGVGVC